MAGKRFFVCEIWTQNKWFRKLSPNAKLFWFYLLGNCDNVGVWEEDWDLASFVMGCPLNPDEMLKEIDGRVVRISSNKLWIEDFCNFQYGGIGEHHTDPIRCSYIRLLRKHGLWQTLYKPFESPLQTPQDKDKDKDKDKEPVKDKDIDEDIDNYLLGENFDSDEDD